MYDTIIITSEAYKLQAAQLVYTIVRMLAIITGANGHRRPAAIVSTCYLADSFPINFELITTVFRLFM